MDRSDHAAPSAALLMGDARDFAQFYRRFEDAVLAYFVQRTGSADTAVDLTAETFARALEGRARFDPALGDPPCGCLGSPATSW